MKNFRCILVVICVFIELSCSRSGKRRFPENGKSVNETVTSVGTDHGKTVVKMTKVNGVYEIPTEVNGIQMHFIFDTGAGMISMSNTEAMFLYKQGKLSKDDIVGNANFTDANGNVSEGLVIRLHEVKVGGRILRDIEASVVPNLKAPLLLGQSALEKFGKVSIDYSKEQITFE